MTISDESPPPEVRSAKSDALGPKSILRVGAWNVRTMFETSKTAQVINEMKRYRLDILGISECRWIGSGRLTTNDGSLILYSGHESTHSHGVAIILSREKARTLMEWEPISERIVRARFDSKYCKLTIIQCYAPTNDAEADVKDDWYEQLQVAVSRVPQHDLLLVIGDLNAKVGADNSNSERVMGPHGYGVMNENGEHLVDFCMNNRLVIGGTIFPHKTIHKLTWTSPDGTTTNQIDHIIINGKWRKSLKDVRVYRGADANSDHFLVASSIRLKLRKLGSLILYSVHESTHSHGVSIILSREKARTLMEWEPISERIVRARFDSKYCKLTIIQCYAPTNDAEADVKDDWYEQLQVAVSRVPQHDLLLVIGDLNAKVGADNSNSERVMGPHGCGMMNENGEHLVDFCMNNRLVIGGTIFPQKTIHKLTWTSPDGTTTNQIDHIIINGKWRKSLKDVRVYRGADANSDHFLVASSIRLKLRKVIPQSQQRKRKQLDISKLKCPRTKTAFVLDLKNCFSALAGEDRIEANNVSQKWDTIKSTYCTTAEAVLGFKKKNKEWVTPETWKLIDERRILKEKLLNTKSPRLVEQDRAAYKSKDKEVKKSARSDKRVFVEKLASEAEQAAAQGDMGTVYKITKQLSGSHNNSHSALVKDRNGNTLSTEREQAARWVQHFKEVLNHPDPSEPANLTPTDGILDINTDPPTREEVRNAIIAMKNGKASGIDNIHAEMLKADVGMATNLLTDLFSTIWEKDTIPDDWTKGLIVKLPKKGNLHECDNWRGITLLSIPSKIFCRVLLKRIDRAIDSRLREEQAGFQKGRGCIDQIYALRNIIEQCLEWNTPLYINFVDFKKAFDSVHRETLWKILLSYGVPAEIRLSIVAY
ncbi:uncharacterized protein LOC106166982 [Lingula anatina]|uniref:Uncharacterized protein LOC106166982 n=1 Tax=Lingula anatina TaxID=7574 RepID=A0A1S3ISC1_LINAN|nr:uncharacterized protein LOC106166982 [Lingula anatina]|eukprot:XP_013401097.1 uncharacterized protein LOC106166982 [Lingula anatina]